MKITITKPQTWKDRMKAKVGKPILTKLPNISDQVNSEMFKYPLYSDSDLKITKKADEAKPKAIADERAKASEEAKPKAKAEEAKE